MVRMGWAYCKKVLLIKGKDTFNLTMDLLSLTVDPHPMPRMNIYFYCASSSQSSRDY